MRVSGKAKILQQVGDVASREVMSLMFCLERGDGEYCLSAIMARMVYL